MNSPQPYFFVLAPEEITIGGGNGRIRIHTRGAHPLNEETILVGSLHGSIRLDDGIPNQVISREATLSRIANLDSWEITRSIGEFVGSCSVLALRGSSFSVSNSAKSPGAWILRESSRIRVFFSEREAYARCREAGLLPRQEDLAEMLLSHHLTTRTPFRTPFEGLERIPPGCSKTIDLVDGEEGLTTIFLGSHGNQKMKPNEQREHFGRLLEGILKLYHASSGRLGLSFSGGIDSSAILAGMVSIGADIGDIVYVLRSRTYPHVDEVLSPFGLKSTVSTGLTGRELSSEAVLSALKDGLGVAIDIRALGFVGSLLRQFSDAPAHPLLNGQNADTLYGLDTFAPGTEVSGLERLLKSLEGSRKRLPFSSAFLSLSPHLRGLGSTALMVRHGALNGSSLALVRSLFGGGKHEHLVPFRDSVPISVRWEEDWKFLLKALSLSDSSIEDMRGGGLLQLLKTFRFFRTVQNSVANVGNEIGNQDQDGLLPFSEGPFVQFFSALPFGAGQVFRAKPLMYTYFREMAGFSFRSVVEKTYATSPARYEGPNLELLKWASGVASRAEQQQEASFTGLGIPVLQFPQRSGVSDPEDYSPEGVEAIERRWRSIALGQAVLAPHL